MTMEKARCVPETSRDEMVAEALALAYDPRTNLGQRAVIDAIAATMHSIGDPLERIWMEDASGKRRTETAEQALAVLASQPNFRYLWALPGSERRNSKSRWLTAAIIDNTEPNSATLFFALPRGLTREFAPHVTLLNLLVQADIVPRYGFGYTREYGLGPGYWRVGDGQPHRYRHARGLIPDVHPLNVLSDIQLRQKVAGVSLKEWILRQTGRESLTRIGPRCFVWQVPADRHPLMESSELMESC